MSSRGMVVGADIHGAIACWDWQSGDRIDYTWGGGRIERTGLRDRVIEGRDKYNRGGGRPLASILPSLNFSDGVGNLFLSFRGGSLVLRARGTYFGFNDTLIYEPDTSSSVRASSSLFSLFSPHAATAAPSALPSPASATQLQLSGSHLLYAVHDTIHAFSIIHNRPLARFHPAHQQSPDAFHPVHSPSSQTLSAGYPSSRDSNCSPLAPSVVFTVVSHTLIAAWGCAVYMCDLQALETCPFVVLKTVTLAALVVALAPVGEHILVALGDARDDPAHIEMQSDTKQDDFDQGSRTETNTKAHDVNSPVTSADVESVAPTREEHSYLGHPLILLDCRNLSYAGIVPLPHGRAARKAQHNYLRGTYAWKALCVCVCVCLFVRVCVCVCVCVWCLH